MIPLPGPNSYAIDSVNKNHTFSITKFTTQVRKMYALNKKVLVTNRGNGQQI